MSARFAVIACVIAASSLAAQQATFRSGIDAVVVDVSVRDGKRVPAGLTAKDFLLKDNGANEAVSDVSFGTLPIDVTIALDVSRSVSGRQFTELRNAIGQLMKDMTPADRARLVFFNETVRQVVELRSDASKAIDAALQDARGRGATSVVDAVSLALMSTEDTDRRQLVMAFSDGTDSTSITSAGTLLDLAKHTNPTVSLVMPAAFLTAPVAKDAYEKLFRSLTSDTGGVIVKQSPGEDLTSTFRKVLDEFRSSYVLRFSPSTSNAGFHRIDVSVPSLPNAAIRARRGYWSGTAK